MSRLGQEEEAERLDEERVQKGKSRTFPASFNCFARRHLIFFFLYSINTSNVSSINLAYKPTTVVYFSKLSAVTQSLSHPSHLGVLVTGSAQDAIHSD